MKIGMTFIEVLIAIVVLGIVLSSMFTGLNFASKYARHNVNKTMALNFAQALMEDLKDVPYNELDDWDEYTDTVQLYQQTGVNIQATRSVEVEDEDDDGEDDDDEDDDEHEDDDEEDDDLYSEISVTVSWDWLGKSYTEEVNTRRYNY